MPYFVGILIGVGKIFLSGSNPIIQLLFEMDSWIGDSLSIRALW